MFYVKQHLTPKELLDKGLFTILDSFEIVDYENSGKKKPLLLHLYPDTAQPFNSHFQKYGGSSKKQDDDGYEVGKFKVEIFLTKYVFTDVEHIIAPELPTLIVFSVCLNKYPFVVFVQTTPDRYWT